MKNILTTLAIAFSSLAFAVDAAPEEVSLEDQLNQLSAPGNQAPAGVSSEQLYAVQSRYNPLRHRHEISIGGANNFTPYSYTQSRQVDLSYRFYLSNRWYLGATGSYVFNDLTDAGQRLFSQYDILPDAAFAKYRADLMAGYHLFYGKFRLSMDQVFYFDQYVALGPGLVNFSTGDEIAAVADIGVVAWFGRSFSMRIGLKDYYVREQRVNEDGMSHNLLGHFELGYLL